jgi:REP element-mobilizing transposase RayT
MLYGGTKHRQPIITSPIELVIFAAIEHKCKAWNCTLLGINATADHLHAALTIPPTRSVAEVIGQIKGVSSREINMNFPLEERFRWQESYGVLTFGEKVMPNVLDYIARQKEHHQQGTTWAYLEHIDE